MPTEPTPKDTIFRDGTASLYHFRNPEAGEPGPVVLLVPSMINRWYVLDLHAGASVAKAFVEAGFDTYCLDWGIPRDEDRYMTWDEVLDRLGRMVRKVCRVTGQEKIGMLGYCMGATLSGIWTALNPDKIAAFANLAGPFDFSEAGLLGEMVDERWFDAEAVASAGNVAARQMQTGFVAMRPTSQVSKWISYASRMQDPNFRTAFRALDTWAEDNIPFPGAAYKTYIGELYQANSVVKGEHFVKGVRVDLHNITCPVLTIATSRDHICPPLAAQGLHDNVGTQDKKMITVRGGHVGAVVGSRASKELYPQITEWFGERLVREPAKASRVTLVNDPPQAPAKRAQSVTIELSKDQVTEPAKAPVSAGPYADVYAAIESGLKADLVAALEAVGLTPDDYSNNTKRVEALEAWIAVNGGPTQTSMPETNA